MGMFDSIKCDYTLPDVTVQKHTFQTKSLESCMTNYTITSSGTLIHHTVCHDTVPEEERPYYEHPDWKEKPLMRLFGCLKEINTGDVELYYTGVINFYTYIIYEDTYDTVTLGNTEVNAIEPDTEMDWYEYEATFCNGKLIKMETIRNATDKIKKEV